MAGTLRSAGGLQKWKNPHPPQALSSISVTRTEAGGARVRKEKNLWLFCTGRDRPGRGPVSHAVLWFCRQWASNKTLDPLTTDLWLVQSANLYPLWLCFYSIASPKSWLHTSNITICWRVVYSLRGLSQVGKILLSSIDSFRPLSVWPPPPLPCIQLIFLYSLKKPTQSTLPVSLGDEASFPPEALKCSLSHAIVVSPQAWGVNPIC